ERAAAFSPQASSSSGSTPAARAASTRSSRSQPKSATLSRCRAEASLRTSLRVLLSAEVIKPLAVIAHLRHDMGVAVGPNRDLEREPRAGSGLLVEPLCRHPAERPSRARFETRAPHAGVPIAAVVL